MTEPGFASLSPTLLARKGGAKPAMRPQSIGISTGAGGVAPVAPEPLDDLGWNDLGEDDAESGQTVTTSNVTSIDAAFSDRQPVEDKRGDDFAALTDHAESRSRSVEQPAPAKAPAEAASSQARREAYAEPPKTKSKPVKRAAFTLRLDPERHLKLRMASTVTNRSAQAIVTEALDAMLADMTDLNSLVAQVHARTPQEG